LTQAAALTVVNVAHARHDEERQVLRRRCQRGSRLDRTRTRTCRNQPMPASLPTKRNWLKSVGLRSAWRRCMRPRYHASTSTTVRGVSSCRGWQRQGDSQTKRLVVEPHQMTGLPTLQDSQYAALLLAASIELTDSLREGHVSAAAVQASPHCNSHLIWLSPQPFMRRPL